MNDTRNKVIFMSDLHLNNDFSFSPSGNGYSQAYTWMNKNILTAASFLDWLQKREDIAELVILGDLLDGWVCPMLHAPTKNFVDILTEPRNAPVINALKRLCRKGNSVKVSYVPGNHDMLIGNLFTRAKRLKGLNVLCTGPGMGVYEKDRVIFAEHGSRFCLFNAPDTWSHRPGKLPEGFFVTRVATEHAARGGTFLDVERILQDIIKKGSRETLPRDFFSAITGKAKYAKGTFVMDGLDGFLTDPTYKDVFDCFAHIYDEWGARQDIVPPVMAPADDLGTLLPAASWIFLTGQPYSPKILIFGHTHKYDFRGFGRILRPASLRCRQYEQIYANAGTWIDGKTCTYIEVEADESKRTYHVRGYAFKNAQDQTLLDEGCVRT